MATVHNPDDHHCTCWSCRNSKRVKLAEEQEAEKRTRALADAADLVVVHVMKDVFEFRHGDRIVNGKLSLILSQPEAFERPVIEMFQALPLLEQHELLLHAQAKKRIRVGDMKFSRDLEVEEAETEKKRHGF
jgi:hypothetical protein